MTEKQNDTKDWYQNEVVKTGDEASDIMNTHCRKTLKNRTEIGVIDPSTGGLVVVRPNEKYNIGVFSTSADPTLTEMDSYIDSFFSNVTRTAQSIGGEVVAVSDILDFKQIKKEDLGLVDKIGKSMRKSAKKHAVGIINGEIAVLGDRVCVPFNFSGTAICYVPKNIPHGYLTIGSGIRGFVFDPKGKPVWANSDGEGTKTELSERLKRALSMYNVFPMVADDAAKNDADIVLISAVMDMAINKFGVYNENLLVGQDIAKKLGVAFTLQPEVIGNRISGYGNYPRNFNATAISTIDEKRLKNLPRPKAGHSLIAIANPNNPNSRSNGFSKLRAGCAEIFEKEFGKDWHKATYQGQNVGEMVAANSELFYPHVKELFAQGLISGFFHMSGGSHQGKLARPLAKQGLHCTMKDDYEIKDGDIFPIPLHERKVIEHYNMSPFDVFRTFPSGRDAYVSTTPRNSWPAQMLLREKGYITRTVGKLKAAEEGKRGVTIKHSLCDINYLF